MKANPEWSVIEHRQNQYGMTVLSRATGLDADLQATVLNAPRLLIFANPTPAVGKFPLEAILEEDLRGSLLIFAKCERNRQKGHGDEEGPDYTS